MWRAGALSSEAREPTSCLSCTFPWPFSFFLPVQGPSPSTLSSSEGDRRERRARDLGTPAFLARQRENRATRDVPFIHTHRRCRALVAWRAGSLVRAEAAVPPGAESPSPAAPVNPAFSSRLARGRPIAVSLVPVFLIAAFLIAARTAPAS